MSAEIIAYKTKKVRPVIEWDWMRCEVEPESTEIEHKGTIAAGQPIEARETAENGETVVAMINHEAVTLKKLYIEPDRIRLQPANPEMKPIISDLKTRCFMKSNNKHLSRKTSDFFSWNPFFQWRDCGWKGRFST
jgi:SOS-response transcriptional repressor LexA